jgi:hypothetical protein
MTSGYAVLVSGLVGLVVLCCMEYQYKDKRQRLLVSSLGFLSFFGLRSVQLAVLDRGTA